MNPEIKREIISWIKVIIVALVATLIINNFLIVHATVPTGSMMDTIPLKSRVVGFRLSYLFDEPERFDVIVFEFPDSEEETILFVKRVIGMPGEKLEVKDGKVYINDSPQPLEDYFVKETPTGDFGPFEIPEDCYFMMGDNREDSDDSRYWNNKFLHKDGIIGKLIFTYYPDIKMIK